jgi:DNA-binding CsgD family transcriptional regulator
MKEANDKLSTAARESLKKYLNERTQEFVRLYKSGKSLQEIGAIHGVTRERVRQVLNTRDIKKTDGGQHVKSLSRTAIREKALVEQLNLKAQSVYGCNHETLVNTRAALGTRAMKLDRIYRTLRANAIGDRVPWNLTFPDVAELLKDCIHKYGKARNSVVVRRVDVEKPFTKDNVEVMRLEESSRLARITVRQKSVMHLYLEGCSVGGIAKQLGISVSTVNQHIHAAKNRNKFVDPANAQLDRSEQ